MVMKVEDAMTRTETAIFESGLLGRAARALAEHGLDGVIVCNSEGGIAGDDSSRSGNGQYIDRLRSADH